MKRFLSLSLILGLALVAPSLRAHEAVAFATATLPEGGVAISSTSEPIADNVCKWTPEGTPGTRRNLGQRIVNGKAPAHVTRFILRVADIPGAVGARAPGAAFVFRITQFESNREIAPLPTPVIEAIGRFPDSIGAGEYLVFDFPGVALEPATTYGFEVGFQEPGEGHTLNFATTSRDSYSPGRIFFHANESKAEEMSYSLRPNNLLFYLGMQ